jgi:hypothetical protein
MVGSLADTMPKAFCGKCGGPLTELGKTRRYHRDHCDYERAQNIAMLGDPERSKALQAEIGEIPALVMAAILGVNITFNITLTPAAIDELNRPVGLGKG